MSEKIAIDHKRVGRIEVEESEIVVFDTLPGFAGVHRFVVMEHSENSPFSWLACLDDENLAFVVANPWDYFPTYDPPVSVGDLDRLGLKTRDETELATIVAVEGDEVWFNLAAPLLINRTTRRAMQVISDDRRYSMRVPMPKLSAIEKPEQKVAAGAGIEVGEQPAK